MMENILNNHETKSMIVLYFLYLFCFILFIIYLF